MHIIRILCKYTPYIKVIKVKKIKFLNKVICIYPKPIIKSCLIFSYSRNTEICNKNSSSVFIPIERHMPRKVKKKKKKASLSAFRFSIIQVITHTILVWLLGLNPRLASLQEIRRV